VLAFRNLYVTIRLMMTAWLVLPAQFALAEALLPPAGMTDKQAEQAGYKRQKFSFEMPSLDFETYVPQKAEISTIPYRVAPIEPGHIGRVLPIGQMKFTTDGMEFENLIFSYRLASPPAALRTCQWQLMNEGYGILHNYAPDELVGAQIFGVQLNAQKKPELATIAYCFARGDILVANYFMAKLPAEEKQAEKAVAILRKTVAGFASNMHFSDNRPNALDQEQIEQKVLPVDNRNLHLYFPKKLDVPIDNTDKHKLPYEMHIIQKLRSGKMFSHLFLWINTNHDPITEENLRKQADVFTNVYISSQIKSDSSSGNIQQKFIGSNSLAGYAQKGISARSYRYKIIDKSQPDATTFFQVTIIRDKDKLYALYYHSLRTSETSPSEYFTGSVGDVAYDMMRDSIRRFLIQ